MSSSTYYRVVCDRHTPPVLLADITCDPDQEASQRHEQELRRWDRHATGEETILNSAGYPYPRDFRPDLYRHSSRKITVYPHEHMFVPELVDPSSQDPVDAILRGEPLPPPGHDGFVRVLGYEMGDTEHANGCEIRIACALCAQVSPRRKALFALVSADTLAIVLGRLAAGLTTVSLPIIDQRGLQATGETIEARIVTLHDLRKELGRSPRG